MMPGYRFVISTDFQLKEHFPMIKETLSKQKVFNYWNDALAIERFHQPKLFQIANAAKITNSGK